MKSCRFLILTFSEVSRDPRILRVIELVRSRGHEIRVCSVDFSNDTGDSHNTSEREVEGCNILKIKRDVVKRKGCWLSPVLYDFVHLTWPELVESKDRLVFSGARGFVIRFATRIYRQLRKFPRFRKAVSNRLPNKLRDLAFARHQFELNAEMVFRNSGWATHVYANDLETLPAGVELKLRDGVKLIYDAHEIWPCQWNVGVKSSEFFGFFTLWERHLVSFVDENITVCDSISDYYEATCPGSKFSVVQSAPSRTLACKEEAIIQCEEVSLYYHGVYAAGRGLEMVVSSLPLIRDAKLYIRAVGDLSLLRSHVDELNLQDRVVFLDPVAVEDLVAGATGYMIGLCPFVDDCLNTHFCLPNKFFEYLLAGCALCVADLVEMKSLVEKYDLGKCFRPEDQVGFAAAINSMIQNREELLLTRKRNRRIAVERLNWEENIPELERVLKRVCI